MRLAGTLRWLVFRSRRPSEVIALLLTIDIIGRASTLGVRA